MTSLVELTPTTRKPGQGKTLLSFAIIACWLFCVFSAMGVIYSTYESRKATHGLEKLRREASGMRVIAGQFLLERSSWSAYSRVEAIAINELNMIVPEKDKTILVVKQ